MDSSLRRRRFVAAAVTGATGLLAGCMGGGSGNGNDTTDGGTGDGNGDATGNGNGNETGSGGDGGGDQGTGEAGNGETDGDTDGSGGSSPSFGDAFGMTNSYAFDIEIQDREGSTASGRFYQGDMYVRFETDQSAGELYKVGDDQYMVVSNRCIKNPGGQMTPPEENQPNPEEYESTVSEYSNLRPSGTTTIDGERVYVYELTPEMTGQSGTTTYYVSVDSGYLRRVESPGAVINFRSWNNVEPVKAPDMECQDMSEMPSSPGGMPGGPGSDMPSGP